MTRFLRVLPLIVASGLGASCAEPDLFVECKLDKVINEICKTSTTHTATCIVEKHPQCDEDACLKWLGHTPKCTRPCTEKGGECPSGSQCQPFDEKGAKRYCVQNGDNISVK